MITLGPEQLLDALSAVREALAIPNGATVLDQQIRDALLVERAGHVRVTLDGILGHDATRDVTWSTAYLRNRLAERPAAGYWTWGERMAELEAAKAAGKAR
jgi:hypothetical protein